MIFTGRVSDAELRHERAARYDRLSQTREIDRLVAPAPARAEIGRGYAFGTVGLALGIALFLLILYAVLR